MTPYTYWVEAVYCIKDNEKRISFPDFGARIEPFRINAADSVKEMPPKFCEQRFRK